MFEREEYGYEPESDGFYATTLPLFPQQPLGPRALNESVLEAFTVVQQAQVVLADAITEWDAADAWSTDGALSASAWLRSKLGVSNGSASVLLNFARKTAHLAPTVRTP